VKLDETSLSSPAKVCPSLLPLLFAQRLTDVPPSPPHSPPVHFTHTSPWKICPFPPLQRQSPHPHLTPSCRCNEETRGGLLTSRCVPPPSLFPPRVFCRFLLLVRVPTRLFSLLARSQWLGSFCFPHSPPPPPNITVAREIDNRLPFFPSFFPAKPKEDSFLFPEL